MTTTSHLIPELAQFDYKRNLMVEFNKYGIVQLRVSETNDGTELTAYDKVDGIINLPEDDDAELKLFNAIHSYLWSELGEFVSASASINLIENSVTMKAEVTREFSSGDLTRAQIALKNYYEAINGLEDTGVIDHHHGDILSAEMLAEVGEYEDLEL